MENRSAWSRRNRSLVPGSFSVGGTSSSGAPRLAASDPADRASGKARPEAKNLVSIFAALSGRSDEAVLAEYAGQGFGAFKPALAEIAVEHLAPVTAELRRLLTETGEIDRVLTDGAERARAVAEPVMDEVRAMVGFWKG